MRPRAEFKSVDKEQTYCLDSTDITGSIPDSLRGVYYRNGPGRFDTADGRRLKHPLDGDGHVLSIEIEAQDRVRVTNRFVRTEGYVAEQSKWNRSRDRIADEKANYRGRDRQLWDP